MHLDMLGTIAGSLVDNFYPAGWDLQRIHDIIGKSPDEACERQDFWNRNFEPIRCRDRADFYVKLGFDIACHIRKAREDGHKLAIIWPVGPVEQYYWTVYFLRYWEVPCDHLYCFNMDEWSDADGNTIPGSETGSFEHAMCKNFYEPLGELTVPEDQRFFAVKDVLPSYGERIERLKAEGAKLLLVYGIGRDFHIAFWEPHFAADYASVECWKKADYALGVKVHPLTIEQNAILSFQSDFTSVPCRANTIGPGVFLRADYCLGGVDAIFSYGASTATVALWGTLRYGPNMWVPSSFIPTLPGHFFFVDGLAHAIAISEH